MAKAKIKSQFVCNECGYTTPKWQGKCLGCGAWNTLTEEAFSSASQEREKAGFITLSSERPLKLDEISLESTPRYKTRISELDLVLGGGFVPGSLVLLGGDPGIGKSTLVLQTLEQLALNKISVLYITGEESKEQIKMRADRLKVTSNLTVVAENNLDKILKHVEKIKPQLIVVDSIQTTFLPHIVSAPGSVSQVRECAGKLLYHSKSTGTSCILIGHVTKEGAIAGPRILEHMVDTVLYFEGENSSQCRILRTIKNRYGSTNEIGVFEMTSLGLKEVHNPSQLFLKEKHNDTVGSCTTATIEGSRPILTEIQALVSSSPLSNPRRTAIGVDPSRLALIIAVLEKFGDIKLFNQDIYVSVTGGLKLAEPASDLAILMSILSSYYNKALSGYMLSFGEIGLTGEIRSVSHLENRILEASKMGFKSILLPKIPKGIKSLKNKIELIEVKNISDVLDKI